MSAHVQRARIIFDTKVFPFSSQVVKGKLQYCAIVNGRLRCINDA